MVMDDAEGFTAPPRAMHDPLDVNDLGSSTVSSVPFRLGKSKAG